MICTQSGQCVALLGSHVRLLGMQNDIFQGYPELTVAIYILGKPLYSLWCPSMLECLCLHVHTLMVISHSCTGAHTHTCLSAVGSLDCVYFCIPAALLRWSNSLSLAVGKRERTGRSLGTHQLIARLLSADSQEETEMKTLTENQVILL